MQRKLALLLALMILVLAACSVLATRPIQEMSDTTAALKAAREVQADTLSPELYRKATEWFNKAKQEYKFKNFKAAKDYAEKARRYAEQAEFAAIQNNGVRADYSETHPAPTPTQSRTYDYPVPTGTPADVYDQRQKEEQAQKNAAAQPSAAQLPATQTPGSPVQVQVPVPTPAPDFIQ